MNKRTKGGASDRANGRVNEQKKKNERTDRQTQKDKEKDIQTQKPKYSLKAAKLMHMKSFTRQTTVLSYFPWYEGKNVTRENSKYGIFNLNWTWRDKSTLVAATFTLSLFALYNFVLRTTDAPSLLHSNHTHMTNTRFWCWYLSEEEWVKAGFLFLS